MSFTNEHIPVLEKYQHHWHGLRDVGVMVNLEGGTITDLQRVYNETVGPHQFTRWCKDCIADLVRQLYQHYEAWKNEQTPTEAPEDGGEPTRCKTGRPPKKLSDGK